MFKMRDLIERIAERHIGELSEAKDGIEKPWTIDGSQWMSLKGVKQPWAFEISPMQYARMGKSQKAAHDKKRAAEWQASMDAKKDWADAVLAASKSGEFDVGDKDVHPEAKSVVRRGKMAADKEKEADLLSRAEKDNEIQNASDLKVGDRVFSVMARGYVTVEKVAKKSIRVAGARGSVKQDVKYLRWLSNDDMKSAALGEDVDAKVDSLIASLRGGSDSEISESSAADTIKSQKRDIEKAKSRLDKGRTALRLEEAKYGAEERKIGEMVSMLRKERGKVKGDVSSGAHVVISMLMGAERIFKNGGLS